MKIADRVVAPRGPGGRDVPALYLSFWDRACKLLRRPLGRDVVPTIAVALVVLAFGSPGFGQVRGTDFQVTKITKNLISTPQFSYSGAQQYPTNQRDRWLEVEVEFAAAPESTDELTFKYFILLNGKLLTGEVTHVNVLAGRENRSVMYVSPRALARIMGNRAVTPNAVQNVGVQILQKGAVKDELSFARTPGQWYAGLPAISGLVLNKNETPFAPLYWDRYEQIKPH